MQLILRVSSTLRLLNHHPNCRLCLSEPAFHNFCAQRTTKQPWRKPQALCKIQH